MTEAKTKKLVFAHSGDGVSSHEPCRLPAGGPPYRSVVATTLIRRMRENSRAVLVEADDGQFYVTKFPSSRTSGRRAANEFFVARLAEALGIPARPAAVVTLPSRLAPLAEPSLGCPARPDTDSPIVGFGSRYPGLPGRNLVVDFLPRRQLARVENLQDAFWGSLAFDLWTGNPRPRRAIFSRPSGTKQARYTAWPIGHGDCFGGDAWDFADDLPLGLYGNPAVYSRVNGPQSFEPYLSRIESIERMEIEKCARGIPPDWLAGEIESFRDLVETLYERRAWVRHALLERIEREERTFPAFR